MSRVLVTGAWGNIGQSAIAALLAQGHQVRAFDLPTKRNLRLARRYAGRVETVWGDLRNPEAVARAVAGQEVVAHLAFIIPKLSVTGVESEKAPDLAEAVNIGGTQHLLAALRAQAQPPRLIFTSSVHVFGPPRLTQPCVTAQDSVNPQEHYSRHKVRCEALVRESGLTWTILRFGATLPLDLKLDPGMFDVPLDNRIEFLHTRDAGLAVANAVTCPDVWGQVWLIAGGPRCQFLYGELVRRILEALGIGMLPAAAFGQTPFCTDWMDTAPGEALLHYQRHTLDDYIQDMLVLLGPRRLALRLFRPLVRASLLRRSPYYHKLSATPLPVPMPR